jgi:hypothetical protein
MVIDRYTTLVAWYYLSEWNDTPASSLVLTDELNTLIRHCFENRVDIPTAAKQVQIFLGMYDCKGQKD